MQISAGSDWRNAIGAMPHAGKAVGLWLFSLAVMVYVMVVLGGLTRLTGSGLSMTEWQPFTLLPPVDDAGWHDLFGLYQASPQYRLLNVGMDLAGFKDIFWLEYTHRLWGRLIGLVFLVPVAVFVWRGHLGRTDVPRLLAVFLLGGLQGVLGWLMVKSGLADRPEVSHYRLALHLLAALAIYGALLWSALNFLRPGAARARHGRLGGVEGALLILAVLVGLTIAAGALVAGLHAGLIYNSFPLMEGRVLPRSAFNLQPVWLNIFENLALVQFDHRVLAMVTWLAAVSIWWWSRRLPLPRRARLAVTLVPVVATLQAGLGISTLLLMVPIPLASAHQGGAFLLFGVVLWAAHETRGAHGDLIPRFRSAPTRP
jgi:cytochrome c oxidase assembly protein subunit 15